MTTEQQIVQSIAEPITEAVAEKDWQASRIKHSEGMFVNFCSINVNGLILIGDIDSSAGVDNTAYALRIRFQYKVELEDNGHNQIEMRIAELKHNLSNYNSKKDTEYTGFLMQTLFPSGEQFPDMFDIDFTTSKTSGDQTLSIMLKKGRLEPQKLSELIESKLNWKIEPKSLDQVGNLP